MDPDYVLPRASWLNISIIIDYPVVFNICGTNLPKKREVMSSRVGYKSLKSVILIYQVLCFAIELFCLKCLRKTDEQLENTHSWQFCKVQELDKEDFWRIVQLVRASRLMNSLHGGMGTLNILARDCFGGRRNKAVLHLFNQFLGAIGLQLSHLQEQIERIDHCHKALTVVLKTCVLRATRAWFSDLEVLKECLVNGTLRVTISALATISLNCLLQVLNYVSRVLEGLVCVNHANDLPERLICIGLVVNIETLWEITWDEKFRPDLLAAQNLHFAATGVLIKERSVKVFKTSDEANEIPVNGLLVWNDRIFLRAQLPKSFTNWFDLPQGLKTDIEEAVVVVLVILNAELEGATCFIYHLLDINFNIT